MNETEYAKLNIIEGSDKVNYAILNENTRKIEAELMRKSIKNTVTGTTAAVTATGPWYSVTNSTSEDISVTINGEAVPVAAESTVKIDVENIENDFEISLSSETDVTLTYFVTVKSYVDSHGGGGGGGTSNYNDLSNRPSVNNVILAGNKTAADLGLVAAETGKGLSTNDFTAAYKKQLDDLPGTLEDKADSADIGAANGIASLGSDGKVPSSQLPAPAAQKEFKLVSVSSESYAAAYKLQVKDGETWSDISGSATINIPKDMVVESGSVKECTADNVPVSGYKKGDKYIDLVIANKANAHIYINVKDLIDNKADGIQYSNTTSKLAAANVQSAIDEIVETLKDKVDETELSLVKSAIKGTVDGQFVTDENAVMTKTVPEKCTKGVVAKISGKTVKDGSTLKSAVVESVVLVGANMIDFNNISSTIGSVNTNGLTASFDKVLQSISVTGTKTVSAWGDYYFVFIKPIKLKAGVKYIFKTTATAANVTLKLENHTTSTTTIATIDVNETVTAFVPDSDIDIKRLHLTIISNTAVNLPSIKVMLVQGTDTSITYSPYNETTLSVPKSIKNLPDYGCAVDGVANEIDFENGVYYHKCKMVNLSNLNYALSNGVFYSSDIKDYRTTKYDEFTIVCGGFLTGVKSVSGLDKMVTMSADNVCAFLTSSAPNIRFYIKASAYTTTAALKTALSDVYLVYPLETPEVINVSDIIFPFQCESGGTVILVNEHNLDMPNTVIYEKEVL